VSPLHICAHALLRTLRIRAIGASWAMAERPAAAWAVLHGQAPLVLGLLPPPRPGGSAVLVSRSGDGDRAAAFLASIGHGTVRGSGSRGALAGLRALIRALRAGRTPVLAVDGPRGPFRAVRPGVAAVALHGPCAVIPIVARPAISLLLPTWDRAELPLPFSRVFLLAGRPIRPAVGEGTEQMRRRVEAALFRLDGRLLRLLGRRA
jgi:lysophospholipid acyltransferase (LPLAT)-like uncharacterized protein